MVNKALLGIAAVVLFVAFGLGVGVGMLIGGSGGSPAAADTSPQTSDTPAASDSQATATSESASAATATPSGDAGDTDDTDERDTVLPREFNEGNITDAIVANINAAREEQGLQPLSDTGTTAENVRQMADDHTEAMADAGIVSHNIDGVTSRDRYTRSDLYNRCSFPVQSYVENADNNELEVIGRTYAGQEYPDNGIQAFNENDTAVANALTDDWLSTTTYRQRLFYTNADRIGVGVTLTSTGTVYATANIC